MTHRFHFENDMFFVNVDEKEKQIRSAEVEGELALLVINAKNNSASLWALERNTLDEHEVGSSRFYEETNEEGTTKTWDWVDEDGSVAVRVAVFDSNNPEEYPSQVSVTAYNSMFIFMTNFVDWTYAERFCTPVRDLETYCLDWIEKNRPTEGE